jgi:hypothetical protein
MKYISRTMPRNITEVERLVPLGEEHLSLINTMFKPEFTHQIGTWALMNTSSKRKILWAFLKAESRRNFTATDTRNFDVSNHLPTLVLEAGTYRLDLNTAFTGHPSSRKLNRRRSASPGTDEVFHRQPVPTLDLSKCQESLARHLSRRFLTPLGVNKVEPIVDEYGDLLEEIALVLEKTQNLYPLDGLWNHPTLSPNSAREVVAARALEDHLFRPQYDPKPPSTPRTMGAKMKYAVKTGTSTHRYYYGMDYRCGAEPSVSPPVYPLSVHTPWAVFPSETAPIVYPVSEHIRRQAFTNARMAKEFKAIFEGETCL